jgi:NADPH:quinone reductase-like Zn-dependent oxidoreductase
MKAFLANAYGGPVVMTLGDIPEPVPRQGEVVVAVKASSVNPVDWKVRNGDVRFVTGSRFPKIYGCDFAGVVNALGPGVSEFSIGESVYGYTRVMFGKQGAHAEKVAISVSRLRRIPNTVTFEQAAALPVAALTALNGLRQCGDLNGKSVIINGATGGVGHFALQIAKARGALVTAVCSSRNNDRAKALGADQVIDYRVRDFTRENIQYDIVFDAFGHLGFAAAARVLAARGIYATTLAGPGLIIRAYLQKPFKGKHIISANLRDKPEDYEALEQLIAARSVVPVIDRVFPLEQAAQAFAAQESGGIMGKVIIRIANP